MATGIANLRRPDPFECKRKGDSEQLLQDFREYRAKIELFLTAVKTVDTHTGDPAERGQAGHKACTSCEQEKAIMELLGGEKMIKLFEQVGVVIDEDSYVGAMDKVEQGIKALTNQARSKQCREKVQDDRGCGQVFREWPQQGVDQANSGDKTMYAKKEERGLHELPSGCTIPHFKSSQLVAAKWDMFKQRIREQKEKYTLTDGELNMLLWEACQDHPKIQDYIRETLALGLSDRPTDKLASIGSVWVLACMNRFAVAQRELIAITVKKDQEARAESVKSAKPVNTVRKAESVKPAEYVMPTVSVVTAESMAAQRTAPAVVATALT